MSVRSGARNLLAVQGHEPEMFIAQTPGGLALDHRGAGRAERGERLPVRCIDALFEPSIRRPQLEAFHA